ncbi:hypothetical protein [uncultured Maribacter sp.]|tara:strand:- start:19937 stop:20080 length:144 start_codon:yes stop_codon:yes gene_type:complete
MIEGCSSVNNDDEVDECLMVKGSYNLSEINVYIAQDGNEDGVASSNI